MENNFDEKILREYAEGALSGAALRELETRLQSDPQLRADLDLYLALKAADNLRLKKQLLRMAKAEGLTPARPPAGITRRLPFWAAMAAGFALLLTAVWWWRQSAGSDALQIAGQYAATPYPPPVALMGGPDERPPAVQAAFLAYRNGDFAAAAAQLSALAADPGAADETLFYAGEALLQTGQAESAIVYFNRVGPGYWREMADWRGALALIIAGKPQAAKPLLGKLRGGARREQAEALLQTLK